MARVAACFARRETRLTCRRMVNGLLSELDDYNCWTLAEAAGHGSPCRMQHLLSRARCDDRAMLDAAADWTVEQLHGEPDGHSGNAILIVDETSDVKSSADCAGAARQHCGATGGVALCQVAVTLTYAVPAGHALIGRALYLPADWAADEERRELAGVPDEVVFATKPELAGRLLRHARDRGVRAAFTVGDEVYGGLDLRRRIRELGTGSATKGARDYHWAMIEITPDDTPEGHDDGHAFLLLRKHRYTGTISYYLCWSPQPVPLAKLIDVAAARWEIEENHQMSKQVTGLDSGQVTTWTSWHRWTAISLLAAAFLAAAAAWQRARDGSTAALRLIPITVPELLRQLRGTVIPWPRRDKAHRDAWTHRRRRHQYHARQARQRWHAYADKLPQP
jgi:SRSO17 transposase